MYYIIDARLLLQIMSKSGTVHGVLQNGDLRVRFNDRTWTLNSAVVAKQVQYSKGDPVRILNDMSMVYQLQEDHGGWIDDMALVHSNNNTFNHQIT